MDDSKAADMQAAAAGKAASVTITERPGATRFSLRIDPAHLAEASKAFDADIPETIGSRAVSGARSALCLGPDEWVLHAMEEERDVIETAFKDLYEDVPHSLVDVSDREITFAIKGPGAFDVLAAGCPLNLRDIPIGEGTRTVFDSAQIVLIRESADSFLIEVWRSFAPHVQGILAMASDEVALGI